MQRDNLHLKIGIFTTRRVEDPRISPALGRSRTSKSAIRERIHEAIENGSQECIIEDVEIGFNTPVPVRLRRQVLGVIEGLLKIEAL